MCFPAAPNVLFGKWFKQVLITGFVEIGGYGELLSFLGDRALSNFSRNYDLAVEKGLNLTEEQQLFGHCSKSVLSRALSNATIWTETIYFDAIFLFLSLNCQLLFSGWCHGGWNLVSQDTYSELRSRSRTDVHPVTSIDCFWMWTQITQIASSRHALHDSSQSRHL